MEYKIFRIVFIVSIIWAFYVALVVRCGVFGNTGSDIWFDESFSVLYSGHSASYILTPHDVHPFGYYMLLHDWMIVFGDGDFQLRLLSMLFGIGTCVVLGLLVEEWYGTAKSKEVIPVFLTMYLLCTTTIQYFTEIRMYAMGIFLATLSLYFLSRYVRDAERKYGIWFVMSTIMLMMTHYYAWFFILIEGVYVLIFEQKKGKELIKKYLLQIGVILCVGVIMGAYFLVQKSRISGMWFPGSDWFSLLSTFHYVFSHPNSGSIPAIESIWGLVFIVAVLGICIRYIFVDGKNKKRELFLMLMVVAPPFIGMCVNLFVIKVYHHRYFLFGAWGLILLLTVAIMSMKKIWRYLALSIVLVYLIFLNINYIQTQNGELRQGFESILSDCHNNMTVIHDGMFSAQPISVYTKQYGCNFKNYAYNMFPPKALNSGGGDAYDQSMIFNESMDQFQQDYVYYFTHDDLLINESKTYNCFNTKYNSGGLIVYKCKKSPYVMIRGME